MTTVRFTSCVILVFCTVSLLHYGGDELPVSVKGRTAKKVLGNGATCYIWRQRFALPMALEAIENLGQDELIVLPEEADWQATQHVMNGTMVRFMRTFRRFVKQHGREPQLLDIPSESRAVMAEEPSNEIRGLFQNLAQIIIVSFDAPTDFNLTLSRTKEVTAQREELPR